MAKKNRFDGVIEAVHYTPDGTIQWVRAYERRGPTFSDRVLIDRITLLEKLKAGKVFVAGKRLPQLASTFDVSVPLRVINANGVDLIVSGDIQQSNQDRLEHIPVI
jgi:hypothetical protein